MPVYVMDVTQARWLPPPGLLAIERGLGVGHGSELSAAVPGGYRYVI